MKTLYVVSNQDFGGKTSLIIGLGKYLQGKGYTVGYIKPFGAYRREVNERMSGRDVQFVRQELGLHEPPEDLIPVVLTPERFQDAIARADLNVFEQRVEMAWQRVGQDKDVLLIEGGRYPLEGASFNLASHQVAGRVDAAVLGVVRYENSFSVDAALGLRRLYGERLIGVVLNAVHRQYMRFVQDTVRPFLEANGLPVLAVLPQERMLLALSVQELVEHLDGQVVCCPDRTDALVEYLMVGAMTPDNAITYFRNRPNKAVITGGDRHDLQLVALETSTRCLILTGGQQPGEVVIARAQEVNVPLVVVKTDTLTAVQTIEQIWGKTSLHESSKAARIGVILQERFDFERFCGMMEL